MYSPEPVLAVATTATEEADSVATVALGPTKRWRELPSSAYPTTASGITYRPFWTGTPAIPA